MKAVEFASTMTQEGQISLPPEVAGEVPAGEQLRVVIMWEPSGSDEAWLSAGRRRTVRPKPDVIRTVGF